jgi:hypothetical protein
MTDTVTSPLTGKALLQKAKELNNLPKREQAKKCGYFTRGKDGVDRVNLTEFYEAVLAARGFAINPEQNKDGRGREPTFRVSVHKNGQIVIGYSYTRSMGLNEGDEFEIKLGYKHIHLIQLSNEQSEDPED